MKFKFGSIYLIIFGIIIFGSRNTMASTKPYIYSLDFEVFGTVQGVFFRKYTDQKAKSLDLKGWCMNTPEGTVKGQLEGEKDKINEMKYWLSNTGSPQSHIEKAVFSDMKIVQNTLFENFTIRKYLQTPCKRTKHCNRN